NADNKKSKGVYSRLVWNGTNTELMELICLLFYSGYIADNDKQDLNFSKFTRSFERLFSLEIKDPFKKRGQLADWINRS
ncbi:MAG: hypothetical protein ACRCUT_13465, partial [Spirochaetota bacterium]